MRSGTDGLVRLNVENATVVVARPDTASAVAIAPWWKKDVQLSTVTLVALAIGAFTLGLLAMRVLAS